MDSIIYECVRKNKNKNKRLKKNYLKKPFMVIQFSYIKLI